jgi:serine/threonine protein kinase
MTPDQERRLEELFDAACALSPEARAAFLDRACAGDAALRQEVESLLEANAAAGEFLLRPAPIGAVAAQKTMSIPPLSELTGTRIGHYKLLEQIGEGGFGVVWMAEQEEPVRRRVALKIIKLGMDTKEVVARFEAERQALAMMDHPHIASVFDGGATDTGRPYFVMELVKGIPITDYCDANQLSTRQRLELFMQVCHAVQHAHQKGVIHRDLKPSNILVTVKDDRPVPKVIDFGIAKATQARLTEKTVFTRFHQWIGTPAYMSPEQAGLGNLDVDTRSDIYSLGVLLYELLTGRPPFDTQKLLAAGYDAVMRTIREEEPPKPSTRLSTLAEEELNAVAARRGSDPARLNRLLRGDLDWIVMKALEKDRTRRYETPAALSQDVRRHLDHQPVTAARPSTLYLTRKFVRRHQVALGTGAALLLVLLAGIYMARSEAAVARRHAEEARQQKEILAAVKQFLEQDLLMQGWSAEGPDREVTLVTVLDRAAAQVGERFAANPLIEAEIRQTLFNAYFALGEYTNAQVHLDRAISLFETQLGRRNPKALVARLYAADLLSVQGFTERGSNLFEAAWSDLRYAQGSGAAEARSGFTDPSSFGYHRASVNSPSGRIVAEIAFGYYGSGATVRVYRPLSGTVTRAWELDYSVVQGVGMRGTRFNAQVPRIQLLWQGKLLNMRPDIYVSDMGHLVTVGNYEARQAISMLSDRPWVFPEVDQGPHVVFYGTKGNGLRYWELDDLYTPESQKTKSFGKHGKCQFGEGTNMNQFFLPVTNGTFVFDVRTGKLLSAPEGHNVPGEGAVPGSRELKPRPPAPAGRLSEPFGLGK